MAEETVQFVLFRDDTISFYFRVYGTKVTIEVEELRQLMDRAGFVEQVVA